MRACAELINVRGPSAVTHRAVAEHAGTSLASTTYYFASLDQMLEAAGELLVDTWVRNAVTVLDDDAAVSAAATGRERAMLVVRAVLPAGDDDAVRAHYENLVGAGRSEPLAWGYAAGRDRFDAVIDDLLMRLGTDLGATSAVALVDGAAVAALNEGRGVHEHATSLVAPFV